jgi:hypothetical protein
MRIVGFLSIYINQKLNPSPEAKVEPVKKFATTHTKERGISTSIVARADDSITNFDFVIVISKNFPFQLSGFQLIKKYFKKRMRKGL